MAKYTENQININETERINAEQQRINNETQRQTKEKEREARETIRQSNESTRISKEAERLAEEVNRVEAEASRVTAEQGRVEAENIRAEFYEGFSERLDSVDSQLAQIENDVLLTKTIHVYPVEGDNWEHIQNIINDDRFTKIILHGHFKFKTYGAGNVFVNIKSNKHIVFDNAKFSIDNTNTSYYRILNLLCVENVIIENPYLIGDNDVNKSTGEWGHGINVKGCKNIQILNAKVFNAFGDGMNISDDENKKCVDIYVNSLYAENCGRQGLTIYGGDNIKLDYIHAKDIRRTSPSACIDIETNDSYSTYGRISIGKVVSDNCKYGVLFAPMAYSSLENSNDVNISIDEINTINETDCAFSFENVYGTNMKGVFLVNTIKAINTNQVISCKNSNKNFYLYVNNIYGQNVGSNKGTDQGAPFVIDSSETNISCINNIIINNVNATIKEGCPVSLYVTNNISENNGAERNCSFTFNETCNLPARINGVFNPVKISGIELSLKDFPQGWSTYHFKGNIYNNKGCTSTASYNPEGFDSIGNEVTFEVVEPYWVYVGTKEKTIYPASLGFTKGFKSNTVGSRITFKELNGAIFIKEILGTWVSQ